MIFNSATNSPNKSLFKRRVYTSVVVEIDFLRRIYTSPVVPRKLLRVFGRKMFDVYIRHWSYRLKKIKKQQYNEAILDAYIRLWSFNQGF